MSTQAEREIRGFLRRLVRQGYRTQDSYEEPCCFFCWAPAHGRPKHREGCLYVRAKELLAKHEASANV